LWTELQSFGGKLAPPSYNTQNASTTNLKG
jgi:hypothetical protein